MADVKWIKMAIDIFDNRKIRYIRREYPKDGSDMILAWLMLLTLAGKINDGGMVYIMPHIPHNANSLAEEFGIDSCIMREAIDVFIYLHMIEMDGDHIRICGWEEYQNIDRMQELREYNRQMQRKSREKRKNASVNDKSMTSQHCQCTEVEVDKEEDKEKDIDGSSTETATTTESIYSDLCRKYGNQFVEERMARAKTYRNVSMETIAKWCEVDYAQSQIRRRTKKNGFANIEQHPYDMQALEAQLMANGKKEG